MEAEYLLTYNAGLESGRTISYEDAVRDYGGTVYKIAYSHCDCREDADDVFQDVFMKLLDYGRDFKSPEHLKAWLIRVTVNCCKLLKRSYRYRKTEALDESIPAPEGDGFDPEPVIKAVRELPEKYKAAVLLYYYEDMTSAEIAAALETNEATVRTRLRRARKMLEEKLRGQV